MNKFHVLITIIIIGVLGILFVVSQKANELPPGAQPTPAQSQLNQISGSSFRDVNLTPQANSQSQMQPQTMQGQPTAGVLEPVPAEVTATIKTNKGDIVLTLYGEDAPNTVRNFMHKAKSGFYDNLIFHRVEGWVIQGGDPNGNGTGGGQMATEINDKPFVKGSLGVARGQNIQISNDAQFFITKTDSSHLNEQYTNFGEVTKGMDVVEKIAIGDKILGITIEE